MNFGRTLSFVLCAAIAPSIAMADDQTDPYAPAPQQPTTTSTTVVTPAPAPAPQQQPVVVVNPDRPPAQTTVVSHEPEGYEVYDQWNAPMFATGAIVFAGSYGASAVVASQSDHPGADRLYVPIVGPWLALNDWGNCPIENANCDKNTTDKVLLIGDGIFQAAGAITMVSSLLSPTHHTVYGARVAKDTTKTRVTPTHNGFAVVGRF